MKTPIQPFLRSTLLGAATLAMMAASASAGTGLFVKPTGFVDPGNPSAGIQTAGSAAFAPFPASWGNRVGQGTGKFAMGFWVRKLDDGNADADLMVFKPWLALDTGSSSANGRHTDVRVSTSILPDFEWHYVYLELIGNTGTFRETLNVWVDPDGVVGPVVSEGNLRIDFGGINSFFDSRTSNAGVWIGSPPVNEVGGTSVFPNLHKIAVRKGLYIDHLSLWDMPFGQWDVVRQINTRIAKFGPDEVPETHPTLIEYYTFEGAGSSSPTAVENTGASYVGGTPNTQADAGFTYTVPSSPAAELFVLVDDVDDLTKFIEVEVDSDYASGLTPPVGISEFAYDNTGANVEFFAPEYIYLDRFRRELGSGDDNTGEFLDEAFYRVRNNGYVVSSGAQEDSRGSSVTFFTQPRTQDIAVTWDWRLEVAIILEANTDEMEGLGNFPGSPTINIGDEDPQTNLKKVWVNAGALVSGEIDGVIDGGDPGGGIRFVSDGYVVENAPAPAGSDRYAAFGGENAYIQGLDIYPNLLFELEQTPDVGGVPALLTSSVARFPGPGDSGRSTLRTLNADMLASDFEAYVTVIVNGGGGPGMGFFGVGSGTQGTFAEPRGGSHIFLQASPDNFNSGGARIVDQNVDGATTINAAGDGTHRLRMIYDATAQTITYEIDQDNFGPTFFTADYTLGPVSTADNGFSTNNAHIFVGGSAGVKFDHLSITPTVGAAIVEDFDYPGSLDPVLAQAFTLEFWTRREVGDVGTDGAAVSFGDGAGNFMWVGFDAADRVRLGRPGAGGSAFFDIATGDLNWHHWAFTYDAGTQEVKAYRDAALVWSQGSVPSTDWDWSLLADQIAVGGVIRDADKAYSGLVNNVRLWRTALDQPAIEQSMITQEYGPTAGLDFEASFDGIPQLVAGLDGDTSTTRGMDIPRLTLTSSYTLETRLFLDPIEYWPLAEGRGHTLFDGRTSGRFHLSYFTEFTARNGSENPSWNNAFLTLEGYDFRDESPGWHTITLVADHVASNGTIYVDGVSKGTLQASFPAFPGFNTDPLDSIGAAANSGEMPGLLAEARVWDSARSAAEVLANHDSTLTGSESGLLAFWDFRTGTATDQTGNGFDGIFREGASIAPILASTEGKAIPLISVNFGAHFGATLPPEDYYSASFPTFTVIDRDVDVANIDGRYPSDSISASSWLRLSWSFLKQYRLKITTTPADSPQPGVNLTALPFLVVEYFDAHPIVGIEPHSHVGIRILGDQPDGKWVNAFSRVTVGTLYRDPTRCITLDTVTHRSGAFRDVSLEALVDGNDGGGQATREYVIEQLAEPGEIVFLYEDTEFRAEIPIGGFLDVSSLSNLNAQLVPDLCVLPSPAGMLNVATGPESGADYQPSSTYSQNIPSGDPFVWDPTLKRLHPLAPGEFTLSWTDAEVGETYLIQIVAGFPTETETIPWDRELPDAEGFRELAGTNFVTQVTFDPVSDAYPASPTGHYRHATESMASRRAPVSLDPNPADRWFYHRKGLTTAGALDDEGLFTAGAAGKTVLLYGYRPDASQVADGTISREGYAVRIAQTELLPPTLPTLDILSSNLQQAAVFDGGTNHYLEINPAGNGSEVELIANSDRTLEFWARHAGSTNEPTADRVVYEQSGSNALLQVGFSGPDHPEEPGTFFFETSGGVSNVFYAEDFDSGLLPSGVTLLGTAELTNGILVLTEAVQGQQGSLVLENPAGGAEVSAFRARFKVRIGDPSGNSADGLSFNFAPDLPTIPFGESGAGTGLSVIFDTFSDESAGVLFGGISLTNTPVDSIGTDLTSILNTGTNFVDVSITLDADGTLDVTFDGAVIFADLATPWVPSARWDFGFGARTGGEFATHYIDDLSIELDGGFRVSFPDTVADNRWHHYAVHTTTSNWTGVYMDGRLLGSKQASIALDADDFTRAVIGQSAVEEFGLLGEVDNLRIWSRTLSADEIRAAMLTRVPTNPAGLEISADFDTSLTTQSGANGATLTTPAGTPADLLTLAGDGPPEVATRLLSKLDTAGYGAGFIPNSTANFNPQLYQRSAPSGAWGPIFPVNADEAFDANEALDVVYYENPFFAHPFDNDLLHPNVAWPYSSLRYDQVDFPSVREHKDKRIVIASRLGTEGVDANGNDQGVFDPARYSDLSVYNQPLPAAAGYNPNEEHALLAPSIKDQLTGDAGFNLGQDAAFALQHGLNRTAAATYTSAPWVLVQFFDNQLDEWGMAAYRVDETRAGAGLFPALDPVTHEPVDAFDQLVPQPANPMYDFDYPSFAGDILIPPYPLNLVIGNVVMSQNRGGNIQVANGDDQRTLWKDRSLNAWVVSGDGRFFYQHWYPMQDDFWFDTGTDGISDLHAGTPVAWLPQSGGFLDSATADPVKVRYSSYWREGYPVLKRGETLTHLGGENKAENSQDEGLPALVAFASAQIIYDSRTPEMTFDSSNVSNYSARVVRPLDRIEAPIAQPDMPTELTPAYTDNIMVDGPRWYFKALGGSLQKRLYYDSLASKLVFRGRLNDQESGDPDLTMTPIASYILEPNTLTRSEYGEIVGLASSDTIWTDAVSNIYVQAQNPHSATNAPAITSTSALPVYYSGVETYQSNVLVDIPFYTEVNPTNTPGSTITPHTPSFSNVYQPLDSLGAGAALVPHPALLTETNPAPMYVTIVENNHLDAGGAVTPHIIRISDERYRGSIKLVEAQDVFDEKVNLRHTGDFGGNTEDVYYQWWVRDVGGLNTVGLPTEDTAWQIYEEGLGLHQVAFAGRPDILLADKFFHVRYGEKNELLAITDPGNVITNDLDTAVTTDASWRLVDINSFTGTYARVDGEPVPFQWAGAANSPQLQANGSKRYIPQLVMGWVKRVLDRVNLYEARYNDFYNNESPAVYSSMLQIAGKPYNGNVALNSDKDVIENVGLIELYETILDRARSLTLDVDGAATDGTNQALLLAATRLAVLYELLASDAYTDAQDPTVRITAEDGQVSDDDEFGLASSVSFVHAFMDQEASLLHEELALLRGGDFLKAYPVFNRLMWNYVKGIGEAAYNIHYNIHDVNEDGFINEFDAAETYPQGHGDAWGHYLSANKMHYELLRNTAFDWLAVPEFYALLDNVIEADYLDEKTFARTAAAKARAGQQIVTSTYRLAYTEDPGGQWQGYTDVDPARAWGVGEWSRRVGHAGLFDWAVGNALLPPDADATSTNELENLEEIDRLANRAELGEIAVSLLSVQSRVDEANGGLNPIGLDRDAVMFDIDPVLVNLSEQEPIGHFEQLRMNALFALENAITALGLAAESDLKLRALSDDTRELQVEALRQDIDYRNALIEILGTPYEGTIGPGQVYPEGYLGPDTLLFAYLDRNSISSLVPSNAPTRLINVLGSNNNLGVTDRDVQFTTSRQANPFLINQVGEILDRYVESTFNGAADNDTPVQVPVSIETADYAFLADPTWGSRTAYGEVQLLLNELLQAELELEQTEDEYGALLTELELTVKLIQDRVEMQDFLNDNRDGTIAILSVNAAARLVGHTVAKWFDFQADRVKDTTDFITESIPEVIGFSNSFGSPAKGGVGAAGTVVVSVLQTVATIAELAELAAEISSEIAMWDAELRETLVDEANELLGLTAELRTLLAEEEAKRTEVAVRLQEMVRLSQEYQSTVAEGYRLLSEREAFNKVLASAAQRNRYADLIVRLSGNETLRNYRSAFEHAQRLVYLAAKAYDYELGLSADDPVSSTALVEDIIRARAIGLWSDDEPRVGKGGIGGILAQLDVNYELLEGQIGINNPQYEVGRLSMRREHFRIAPASTSDENWRDALANARVPDLWQVPVFRNFCRPFDTPDAGPQPGLVIPFSIEITPGKNVFGRELGGEDHAYSSSVFATRVRKLGVWFENYNQTGLAATPRVYLVPAGADVLRVSNAQYPEERVWNVIEQQIPLPFPINTSDLLNPDFIPSLHSVNGSFAQIRRLSDFRAYHTGPGVPFDETQLVSNTRLITRSVWNTQWYLIIPGAGLHANPDHGLDLFVGDPQTGGISDIKLFFDTYAHEGY